MIGLLRVLFLVVALWFFLAGMRRLFRASSLPERGKDETPEQVTALLVQDPQCGRFLSERDALQISVRGYVAHFCSQECLDLYRKSRITRKSTSK
jgi:uncharacterized protein